MEMNDEEFTREKMAHNPLVRHLFNKIGSDVIVYTNYGKFAGVLKTIDISGHMIEIQDEAHSYFFGLKDICLKTKTGGIE
jgi:hypothetical protein